MCTSNPQEKGVFKKNQQLPFTMAEFLTKLIMSKLWEAYLISFCMFINKECVQISCVGRSV